MANPNPYGFPIQQDALSELLGSLEAALSGVDSPDRTLNPTASGRAVKSVSTSQARIPGSVMSYGSPGSGSAQALYNSPRYVGSGPTVQAISEQLQRARIDEMLSKIDLNLPTDLPPLPQNPIPASPGMEVLKNVVRGLGPAFVLDLLGTHGSLNTGEDERMRQYRADDLRSSGGRR